MDLEPERPDLRPKRLDLRPERLDLRPEGSDEGGGLTNKKTNGRTNESPPVFYRTSSPLGPLPKNTVLFISGEENHRFCNMIKCVAGKLIKGRGKN